MVNSEIKVIPYILKKKFISEILINYPFANYEFIPLFQT